MKDLTFLYSVVSLYTLTVHIVIELFDIDNLKIIENEWTTARLEISILI